LLYEKFRGAGGGSQPSCERLPEVERAARLGLANAVADLADNIGVLSLPVVALLWMVAALTVVRGRTVRLAPWMRPLMAPGVDHV
jgi:hypothetical protein